MEPKTYPGSRMALLDARVVALAWLSMLLAATFWIVEQLLDVAVLVPLLPVSVALFLITVVAHVVLSFRHACPVCGKHPTIEGFGPVHENSSSQAMFTGSPGAILNILKRRQLVCIHCGTHFTINA
jgi:hypothetical protein